MIRDVIGKTKQLSPILPRYITINNTNIYNKINIAEQFNQFFVNFGPNLDECFENYMTSIEKNMPEYELTDDEFKEAFFSLKANKSAGYDDISYDVVKHCFDFLEKPLKHIFKISLTKGIVPDQLK